MILDDTVLDTTLTINSSSMLHQLQLQLHTVTAFSHVTWIQVQQVDKVNQIPPGK